MNDLAEKARELLSYDPETGIITRKVRTSNRVNVGDQVGCEDGSGYLQFSFMGRLHRAHRMAWLIMTGSFPDDQIDHINGVRHDNRWVNLRAVSRQENAKNQRTPSDNISGVIGVCWDRRERKWRAEIQSGGVKHRIGHFLEFSAAVAARKQAENGLEFHQNHGRVMK